MSLLSKLFGYPDPTRQWARVLDLPMPVIDLNRPAFGHLVFGDSVELAESFGKPHKTKITQYCVDLYYQPGFELGFELGRFVELTLYFHPASDRPGCPEVRFSNGAVVTPATTKDELVHNFGDQYDPDAWKNSELLQYQIGKLVAEFNFHPDAQHLEYATIYIDE